MQKVKAKNLCMRRLNIIRWFLSEATYLLVTHMSCLGWRQIMSRSVYLFKRRKSSCEGLLFSCVFIYWAVPFIVNDPTKITVLQAFISLKTAAAIGRRNYWCRHLRLSACFDLSFICLFISGSFIRIQIQSTVCAIQTWMTSQIMQVEDYKKSYLQIANKTEKNIENGTCDVWLWPFFN